MENLQGERERESESANGPMPVGSPDGYKGNKRKYTNEGHVLGWCAFTLIQMLDGAIQTRWTHFDHHYRSSIAFLTCLSHHHYGSNHNKVFAPELKNPYTYGLCLCGSIGVFATSRENIRIRLSSIPISLRNGGYACSNTQFNLLFSSAAVPLRRFFQRGRGSRWMRRMKQRQEDLFAGEGIVVKEQWARRWRLLLLLGRGPSLWWRVPNKSPLLRVIRVILESQSPTPNYFDLSFSLAPRTHQQLQHDLSVQHMEH